MKRSEFKLFVGFLWPENGTCVTCGKDSNQVIILNLFFRMKLENHSWHTQYWLDSQTDQAKRKNTFTTDCKQFYDTLNHTMCKIGYKPTRHWPRQIFITQCEVWRDIHHTRHSHGVVNVWWRSRYSAIWRKIYIVLLPPLQYSPHQCVWMWVSWIFYQLIIPASDNDVEWRAVCCAWYRTRFYPRCQGGSYRTRFRGNLAVQEFSGPKLTRAPIELRSSRDCRSWFGGFDRGGGIRSGHLIDDAEQLVALQAAWVVAGQPVEVVLASWNLGCQAQTCLFPRSCFLVARRFWFQYLPLARSHPLGLDWGRWRSLWPAPGAKMRN